MMDKIREFIDEKSVRNRTEEDGGVVAKNLPGALVSSFKVFTWSWGVAIFAMAAGLLYFMENYAAPVAATNLIMMG